MSEKKSSKCMKSAHAAYVPTLPLKSVTLYRARPSFPEDLFVLDAALCAAARPGRSATTAAATQRTIKEQTIQKPQKYTMERFLVMKLFPQKEYLQNLRGTYPTEYLLFILQNSEYVKICTNLAE